MMDDKPDLPVPDRSNPTQPGKLIVADCDNNRSTRRDNDDMRSRGDVESLKPCPFCGGKAHWPEPEVNIPYVGCTECGATAQDEVRWNTRTIPEAPGSQAGRVDAAKYAVARARTQLARLLDHAVSNGLDEQAELAADTFAAIRRLDEAFPRTTDMGTGLPIERAPTPSAGDVESLTEALQPILAKCEQYDRKENAWSKRYSDGFTVGISLGTCRRIRAAITSHDTAILSKYRDLIAECGKRFREYERIHQGKVEPKHEFVPADLREKIERNREMADMCDAALKEGASVALEPFAEFAQ